MSKHSPRAALLHLGAFVPNPHACDLHSFRFGPSLNHSMPFLYCSCLVSSARSRRNPCTALISRAVRRVHTPASLQLWRARSDPDIPPAYVPTQPTTINQTHTFFHTYPRTLTSECHTPLLIVTHNLLSQRFTQHLQLRLGALFSAPGFVLFQKRIAQSVHVRCLNRLRRYRLDV
jgi:hypothetical protein